MVRLYGSGLSLLLHVSVIGALGVSLGIGFDPPPVEVSVAPVRPTLLGTRVPGEAPAFRPPDPTTPPLLAVGGESDAAAEFSALPEDPADVIEEVIPPHIPRRPDPDRPLAPSATRLSDPLPLVTAPPAEIKNPPPAYPRRARRHGLEGEVLVEIVVEVDGRCGEVRVVERKGASDFEEAVLEALRAWRFRPASRAGRVVEATHRVRFTFRLNG
jgi:protein TonB